MPESLLSYFVLCVFCKYDLPSNIPIDSHFNFAQYLGISYFVAIFYFTSQRGNSKFHHQPTSLKALSVPQTDGEY